MSGTGCVWYCWEEWRLAVWMVQWQLDGFPLLIVAGMKRAWPQLVYASAQRHSHTACRMSALLSMGPSSGMPGNCAAVCSTDCPPEAAAQPLNCLHATPSPDLCSRVQHRAARARPAVAARAGRAPQPAVARNHPLPAYPHLQASARPRAGLGWAARALRWLGCTVPQASCWV